MFSKQLKYIGLLLCMNCVIASAQYVAPDTLKKIIATAKKETDRIDAMNWLAFRYYQKLDTSSCRIWAERALSSSEKIGYKNGEGFAYINLGNINAAYGPDSLVTKYNQQAKKALETGGDKGLLGIVHSNLALHSMFKQSYLESLRELNKSLRLQQESGFQFGLAHSYMSIGTYHFLMGDYIEAEKNLSKSEHMFRVQNENTLLSYSYYFGGLTYSALKKYRLAKAHLDMAREIFKNSGETVWFEIEYYRCVAMIYLERADSCLTAKNKTLAVENFMLSEKNLNIAVQKNTINDYDQFGLIYNNLGLLYLSWKKYALSKKFFLKSLESARITRDKRIFDGSHDGLSQIDSINNDFESALANYKNHILYRDSINSEKNIRDIERYKIEFETEKNLDDIKLLTAENELNTAIVSKQKQQKNFVFACTGILLLAGIYGFQRYRNKRRIQSQQEIAEERQRISRDLHDEIGATLSGIAMYGHMVKNSLGNSNTDMAVQSADIIQESATEMVNKLNDIVWLIKPQNESMEALIGRLNIYAAEMCAAKNIVPDIQVTGEAAGSAPPLEQRKNIYLICKEAINNAAKYSGATVLTMRFFVEEKWLHISIKDNGQGYDPENSKNGNGLENMQNRARQIGASLDILTAPGNGCAVELKLKITQ